MKEKKLQLIETLCSRNIETNRIITTNDGFVVITVNEHHADSIFKAEARQEHITREFQPVMPPELNAKKRIIIPRVDDLIYEWSSADIEQELIRKNTWIGGELESVFKFPNSPTIKIIFTQTALATKCTEIGLKAFNISIPPPTHEIKPETYIPIKSCMKCYTLEDHFTSECLKSKEYKVCSECSSEGHVWHQCKEEYKKCINCGEAHSTMAMKCNERKEILKEKRTQLNEGQKMSYADVSQVTLPPRMPSFKIPQITKEVLKINICVAHAQAKNQENIQDHTQRN